MGTSDMDETYEDIGLSLKQLSDGVVRKANLTMRDSDMTLSQIRILDYLAANTDHAVSQRELREFFKVTHPTIIGLVSRLESKGTITISTDETDHRLRVVTLTDKGREYTKRSKKERFAMDQALLKGFNSRELDEFRGYLKRVLDNVEKA